MAISKIHPIRRTLTKAIDYIINPDKTEELYVSTFGCSKESAAEEFGLTKKLGNEHCFTLAQHVIQSFKPGEVSPEEAHKIGIELINKLTGSQHEYVIATHVDKDHIHNHIIFNHTNFVTHKAFRSNLKTVQDIREISDRLCKEHGLSIIENPQYKGLSRYEWMLHKKNKSYKKRLQNSIDICINESNSFEEFLTNMQKLRYEIKRGKHIAFRKNETERFTRAKSFGENYTEDKIKERILAHPPFSLPDSFLYNSSIGLISNMENYLNHVNNPVYRQKVYLNNIKKISATYNYLVKNNIDSLEQLQSQLKSSKDEYKSLHASLNETEKQLHSLNELLKHTKRMQDYSSIWNEYISSGKSDSFLDTHRTEIMLYEASLKYIRSISKEKKIPSYKFLDQMIQKMQEEKSDLHKKINIKKERLHDLEMVQKNISQIYESEKGSIEKQASSKHIQK